jgi:hypothetical protein
MALKHTRLECIQEQKLMLVPACSQLWIASYLSPSLRHILNEKLNGALHQNVLSWVQLNQVQAEGTKVNLDFDFLLHDIRIQALIDSKFNMVHHLGATWTKQLFARYMQQNARYNEQGARCKVHKAIHSFNQAHSIVDNLALNSSIHKNIIYIRAYNPRSP